MSEALVVLNNGPQDLAIGGVGLDSRLFKLKPATLEIVQRTSRQEGAEPGRFRDTATGTHYDTMEWVLLMNPIRQRAAYHKGEFSKDSKFCFSYDNVSPSKWAKDPQAPFCATCQVGSWETYRKTGDSKDIPLCKEFWHLVLADRATQMPYYFNVKGLSISPFEAGMQNVARTVAALEANVKQENKAIAARNTVAKAAAEQAGTEFKPEAFKPRPNLFDIKFPVSITSNKTANGISYVLVVGKPMYMNEEARKEFGALYLDFANRRAQGAVQTAEESEAAADAATFVEAQAPTRNEVAAVVGTVVTPAKSDITI